MNSDLGSMLIYAARYAHTRKTGAAMQVVNCAVRNWGALDHRHKLQLLRESKEATCNLDDWKRLRRVANDS